MLVIAPLHVCYNVWPREVKKWDNFNHLRVEILHGKDKAAALARDADVYVINPEGLQWLFASSTKRKKWDILCVDESTKFKDSSTKRFKLMRRYFEEFPRRWILTGTLIPNGIHDLFGQIYILDFGHALGRYVTHFRNKYFTTEAWKPYSYIAKEGAWEEITNRIAPYSLRLKAEDYLEMPGLPPIEPTKVEMPPAAWKAYKEIENDFITRLGDGVIVAANQAVAGGKCRQLANGALYEDVGSRTYIEVHESKLDALQSILEEINGSPTLVLYEFHHDRERILRRIGSSTPCLGGGTTASKSTRIIENFNRGNIPVLLGHPGSMGHGLNLQERCHHVIWFGITWNFEYYDQAIRRVYRQGQQHPVFLYHIVAEGTLDETVMEVLRSKERTQENLYSRLTTWRNGNGTGRTSEGDVQRDVGRSLEHNDHISREGGSQGR
jgi:hypothetical protein